MQGIAEPTGAARLLTSGMSRPSETLVRVHRPHRNSRERCGSRTVDRTMSSGAAWERDLTGEWLTGARMAGEDLRATRLRQVDLTDADLRGADLRGADLTGADLTGADLRGADLRGARLASVRLRSTRCDSRTRWPEGFRPSEHRGLACEASHEPGRRGEGQRHLAFFLTAGAVFAADQLVKALVRELLPRGGAPRWLPGDALFLQQVENHGLNLQLLEGAGPALTLLMGMVLAVVLAIWLHAARRGSVSPRLLVGLALVFGGGLGNALDRVLFGAVLDYIGIYGGPVINLADLAVLLGLFCLDWTPSRTGCQEREERPQRLPARAGMEIHFGR